MKVLRSSSGLVLRVPDGRYEVKELPKGFRLVLAESARGRAPIQVRVELRAGRAPSGDFPDVRTVHGRSFHTRVDVEEGGSSGDEHVLRAYAPAGDQHVWVEQAIAIEPPAKPSFTAAWEVIEGLEVSAKAAD